MNKAELVKALKNKSTSKKTIKKRKMRGGALSDDQIIHLLQNPGNYLFEEDGNVVGRISTIRQNAAGLIVFTIEGMPLNTLSYQPQDLSVILQNNGNYILRVVPFSNSQIPH